MAPPPTILHVDGRYELPDEVVQALRSGGYAVLHTGDPEEAMRLSEERKPVLVVMDIVLEDCDGPDLMAGIREVQGGSVPVLVVTEVPRDSAEHGEAIALGVYDFLTRPIPDAKLLAAIHEVAPPRWERPEAQIPEVAESREPVVPDLAGDLSETPMPELLARLRRRGESGVLAVGHGGIRVGVQLRNGSPVGVRSSRQGGGLVAEALLYETFRWEEGRYAFSEGAALEPDSTLELAGDPAGLLLAGVLDATPGHCIRERLAKRESLYVSITEEAEAPLYSEGMAFTARQRQYLDDLGGADTLSMLLESREFDDRLVYALWVGGWLELRTSPTLTLTELLGDSAELLQPELEAPEPLIEPPGPAFEEPLIEPPEPAFEAPEPEIEEPADEPEPGPEPEIAPDEAAPDALEVRSDEAAAEEIDDAAHAVEDAPEDGAEDALALETGPDLDALEVDPDVDDVPLEALETDLDPAEPGIDAPDRSVATPASVTASESAPMADPLPEPEPVPEPEPPVALAPEPMPEPEPALEPEPEPEPAPEPPIATAPEPAPEPAPTPEPETAPVPVPVPEAEPEPIAAAPEPAVDPEPAVRPLPPVRPDPRPVPHAPVAAKAPAPSGPPPDTSLGEIAPFRPPTDGDEDSLSSLLRELAEKILAGDDFQALGVAPTATDAEVRSAYEVLVRQVPEIEPSVENLVLAQRAKRIRSRIDAAYKNLRDEERRHAYSLVREEEEQDRKAKPSAERALEGERWFRKGKAHLDAKRAEEAAESFGMAAHLDPEQGEYAAHLGYALFLTKPKDLVVQREAMEHVAGGIKRSPKNELSYLYLGRILKAKGELETAKKIFKKALRIKPDFHPAVQELRVLALREKKDGQGVLGRLMGR